MEDLIHYFSKDEVLRKYKFCGPKTFCNDKTMKDFFHTDRTTAISFKPIQKTCVSCETDLCNVVDITAVATTWARNSVVLAFVQ
ncbi:hypothetical protein ILUMI_18539, partial [Ignelater luminosus]